MKKNIILIITASLCLMGCSSFWFGCDEKEKREDVLEKPTKLSEIYLTREEIMEFQKRSDQHYQGIIINNRSMIPESPVKPDYTSTESWKNIQHHLNQYISKDVQNIINPQADAQKYINLFLSLLTDRKDYHAFVLETNDQVTCYPGSYIFISRMEIQNCQDEAVLAELLSFKLIRNEFLNKNIDYSLFSDEDVKKSLTDIIQKDKLAWEKYALDPSNNINPEVKNQVAALMIRAGFKPSFAYSLDDFPGFHSQRHKPIKNLEFLTPLKRHKKVFD